MSWDRLLALPFTRREALGERLSPLSHTCDRASHVRVRIHTTAFLPHPPGPVKRQMTQEWLTFLEKEISSFEANSYMLIFY